MRIAYVCADPGVPVFGRKGCSVHVQEMLRAMLRAGHTVQLFARRFDGPPPADLAAVTVHPLPLLPKGEVEQRELSAYQQNGELARVLDGAGPFDLIYERHALWSFGAMELAARAGTPSVLEVNAPLIEEQRQHRALHHEALAESAAREAFQQARHIVAVSPAVADYARSLAPQHAAIVVEPNGVDVARFQRAAQPRPRTATDVTVGFVGTLKPWHGVPLLLEAFARLAGGFPGARLLIVGDGPERTALDEQAAALNIASRTEFTGAVAPEAIPALLAEMDIAVAPYPRLDDFYFSPLKVLEYMAAGRAVVASRIGVIPEWIEHAHNGWLVAPGDVGALTEALMLLASDPARRAQLGAAAQASVTDRHDWSSVWERIYRRVQDHALVNSHAR